MGFSCGIVGLPNVGKSTLFNALTRAAVPASNYPFCTIDPNVGVVPVPDPRLTRLGQLVPTERVVPTAMDFVDIAGLVKGASRGEGLGNQFLNHIGQVDAIAHVVRCFDDPQVAHVGGAVDPARDIEIIETELALRDLAVATAALARQQKLARGGDKTAAAAATLLERVVQALDRGQPVRAVAADRSSAAWDAVRALNLLTEKSVLYVANLNEADLAAPAPPPSVAAVQTMAKREGAEVLPLCAALEAQIAALDSPEERHEFLAASGLREAGLDRLVRAGHAVLNLITFFTIGPKEDRAWTIRRGTTAQQAAGKIHSDMARGFIRAEVINFEDFVACGSEAAAREQGKLRLEGKEYVVRDGDLLRIRFSV